MKLPKVPIEDYLIITMNLYLKHLDSNARAWLISGDPEENYFPKPNSLTLDLRIHRGEKFKLNFEGDKEFIQHLETEDHVNHYMAFFHNTKGVKETIDRDLGELGHGKGTKFSMEVRLNGQKYELYVTVFDIK